LLLPEVKAAGRLIFPPLSLVIRKNPTVQQRVARIQAYRKKAAGARGEHGKRATREPLAAINEPRSGSSGSAKMAHFLAATDNHNR
jgi:hypothetical protein